MSVRVHPTAVVETGAELADGVSIGPFSYVGNGVELGEGTELLAHATVLGPSRLGRRNRVHPYATIGGDPQDRSFAGEPTELVIGDDNVFREGATVHRGTARGGGVTRIGDGCLFMVGAHVAHDATVGDGVTLANATSLGGHVAVGDRFVSGGHVAVAPFVRLGELAFAAGGALIERDVPPFVIVSGDRARVRGLNRVGLRRAEVPLASQRALKEAYRVIFRGKSPIAVAAEAARDRFASDPFALRLVDSVLQGS
jgi:UDP-N-acetylglucosamine acyltransferase